MNYEFDEMQLEVEVHPDKYDDFVANYRGATGENPCLDNVMTQTNKWGAELRMYFNASDDTIEALKTDGYSPSSAIRHYKDKYKYRINNTDLFWKLVDAGYKL